jgi:hypothetical protein
MSIVPLLIFTICSANRPKGYEALSFLQLATAVEKEVTHPESTLIIFDVEETLYRLGLEYDEYCTKARKLLRSQSGFEYYSSLYLTDLTPYHVDKRQVEWFNGLQKTSKVICLSDCWAGEYGILNSYSSYQYNSLKKLGYNINNPFDSIADDSWFTIKDITTKDGKEVGNKRFHYKNGIICSHEINHGDYKKYLTDGTKSTAEFQDKGLILLAFLNELSVSTGWKPSKIIYIDNNESFIKSVANALQYLPIKGVVVLYSATKAKIEKLKADHETFSKIKEKAEAKYLEHRYNERKARSKSLSLDVFYLKNNDNHTA